MNLMETMTTFGHEKVLFVNNEKAGLKAIIAVHNTVLGPAIGGCRLWPYASEEDALFDVMRLSRGMSHKNAAAGLKFGGGKAVIIADPSQKTEAMFEAFGEAVNNLGGDYITAEDVNTTCDDALVMLRKTNHICGLPQNSGDPSPFTARGVWQGIKATAKVALGTDDLNGVTIAVITSPASYLILYTPLYIVYANFTANMIIITSLQIFCNKIFITIDFAISLW